MAVTDWLLLIGRDKMLSALLNKVIGRGDLTEQEAADLLGGLLSEEATDAMIGAALAALATKGETEAELAGFARAMRLRSAPVRSRWTGAIDTCGTGGSPAKVFNISTTSAFVVAACGVPVAKHGNVGVTSRSGSADVLRALGVEIDLAPERVAEIFDETGICFMLAPRHHSATKRVGAVRRQLGVRTIFNLLGPLTNPAAAPYQLIGVSNGAALDKMARAIGRLGTTRTWVVRGEDGLDEITLATKTVVHEILPGGENGEVRRFELSPDDFGIESRPIDDLRGETAEGNAAIISAVLAADRRDGARDIVMINAAAALVVAGVASDLVSGVALARESLDSGRALAKLDQFRRATREG